MKNSRLAIASFLSATMAIGYCLTPAEAEACGGMFCDGGPQPMPVDQTGEDILFVNDGDEIEVHIRIEYTGEAENFAWVVPMLSEPTQINVGSEQLIVEVKNFSVPTYSFTTTFDQCEFDDDQDGNGDGGSAGQGETGASTGDPSGGSDTEGGVNVIRQERVGAFDVTVIQGDNARQVIDWLDTNGYQQDPEAEPIIAEYVNENHLFAAIKLTGNADVEEIHPIAFRFPHTEACVPLRLTRIAAVDDMAVRTYFLGDNRVVPETYRHVLVNPLMLNWPMQATNYTEVIGRAVDADGANGRAFVTEYAGTSEGIQTFSIFSESWDAEVFRDMAPEDVTDTLEQQGLFFCDIDFGGGCAGLHPLTEGLLAQYLPVPDGLSFDEFYANTEVYVDQIDLEVWAGGQEFADKLLERIIDPGQNAVEIVRTHDYLTRMYTVISPHEMTEDPMFHENAALEDVANIRTATQRVLCNNASVWTLPDGREVYVPNGERWPEIDGNPWEAEIHEIPELGAKVFVVDNQEMIDDLLADYNERAGWRAGGREDGGGEGSESGGGCGCTSAASPIGIFWAGAFLFGFGWIARRRYRR